MKAGISNKIVLQPKVTKNVLLTKNWKTSLQAETHLNSGCKIKTLLALRWVRQ